MDKSLLQQELVPLKAKIEQARGTLGGLQTELRAVKAELEGHAPDRKRFDALRETCKLLKQLDEMEGGELFWGELPEIKDPVGHVARVQSRVASFDEKINRILGKQDGLKEQIELRLDELDLLHDEVDEAYDRDERRDSEFAIVRELSAVPHAAAMMPWSTNGEGDRRYRRTMMLAMLFSLIFAVIIEVVVVPKIVHPVIAQVPERLAMMVRQEHPKPLPVKKSREETDKKEAKKEEKPGAQKVADKPADNLPAAKVRQTAAQEPAKAAPVEQVAAPKRATNSGVLAFKEAFKDLLEDNATPKLGTEARVISTNNQSGRALAGRNLVSGPAGRGGVSGSGGIGSAAFSRNGGSGGIGDAAVGRNGNGSGGNGNRIGRGGVGNGNGTGFTQVRSNIAGVKESAKPLTASGRPSRTDEEIQLVFDRYKSALYRIYNTELRKDPTLRGKMVLKISIEPGGELSTCTVESCNMNAPEFNEKIVERVKKINFGPKDGVPRTTILYPIDFLPQR